MILSLMIKTGITLTLNFRRLNISELLFLQIPIAAEMEEIF